MTTNGNRNLLGRPTRESARRVAALTQALRSTRAERDRTRTHVQALETMLQDAPELRPQIEEDRAALRRLEAHMARLDHAREAALLADALATGIYTGAED